MAELGPHELALARAAARPGRKPQALAVERVDDGARRSGPLEGLKQMAQCLLDGAVGIEHGLAGGVIDESDRQWGLQLAAAGLGQDPALQPGADEVQLGLAHRALQAEQQPVVERAGVIQPVGVADHRVGHAAQIQQPVPVDVVPGQPGDLSQAQHSPSSRRNYPVHVHGNRTTPPLVERPDHPESLTKFSTCVPPKNKNAKIGHSTH